MHPQLTPEALRGAAAELYAEQLFVDLSLENDPTASRAHAFWRGAAGAVSNGAPIEDRAGMLLQDTTTAGPRSAILYALVVATAGYFVAAFLGGSPWPFTPDAAARPSDIAYADAVVAVLPLVPGFLYTRLALPTRHSVATRVLAGVGLVSRAGSSVRVSVDAGFRWPGRRAGLVPGVLGPSGELVSGELGRRDMW